MLLASKAVWVSYPHTSTPDHHPLSIALRVVPKVLHSVHYLEYQGGGPTLVCLVFIGSTWTPTPQCIWPGPSGPAKCTEGGGPGRAYKY